MATKKADAANGAAAAVASSSTLTRAAALLYCLCLYLWSLLCERHYDIRSSSTVSSLQRGGNGGGLRFCGNHQAEAGTGIVEQIANNCGEF